MLISIFNIRAYKKRYGGLYANFLEEYNSNSNLSLQSLKKIQEKKYKQFLTYVLNHSDYYKNLYKKYEVNLETSNIAKLPITTKEDLQKHTLSIQTIRKSQGIKSKTGGTTGKYLEVLFTIRDMQERFAVLDFFRNKYGYKLGEKIAWFSGKNIVFHNDVKRNRFWKTDYYYNIRYYSTFHIKSTNLTYYIEDLIKYKPKFIAGFPSIIVEIAHFGLSKNIDFPSGIIKAIFPTAETITPKMRKILETFYKSKVYDQYASSEGAPFIFECKNQRLHLQLQTVIFEVLDKNLRPAKAGRLIVTSFTTHGTPLIRYDIGDLIVLSDASCNCGDNNPVVERIVGRRSDFVYSPERGIINLGNISNIVKQVKGVIKFQVVQNELDHLNIYLVTNKVYYSQKQEQLLVNFWKEKVGHTMTIRLHYKDEIANESNGKYKLVKNNIKNLINHN